MAPLALPVFVNDVALSAVSSTLCREDRDVSLHRVQEVDLRVPAFVAMENQLVTRGAIKLSTISRTNQEERETLEQQQACELWSVFRPHFISLLRSRDVQGAWYFWNQAAVQFLVQHCSEESDQRLCSKLVQRGRPPVFELHPHCPRQVNGYCLGSDVPKLDALSRRLAELNFHLRSPSHQSLVQRSTLMAHARTDWFSLMGDDVWNVGDVAGMLKKVHLRRRHLEYSRGKDRLDSWKQWLRSSLKNMIRWARNSVSPIKPSIVLDPTGGFTADPTRILDIIFQK